VYSLFGALLSAGLSVTALGFMVSNPQHVRAEFSFPAISVTPGQLLFKDIGLLAICLWIALGSSRRSAHPAPTLHWDCSWPESREAKDRARRQAIELRFYASGSCLL
jgi:hypothetical protein